MDKYLLSFFLLVYFIQKAYKETIKFPAKLQSSQKPQNYCIIYSFNQTFILSSISILTFFYSECTSLKNLSKVK